MRRKFDPVIAAEMAVFYAAGESLPVIAERFGKGTMTVYRWLMYSGVNMRKLGELRKGNPWTEARRKHHPVKEKGMTREEFLAKREEETNGNTYLSKHGYIVVKVGRRKRQYEHVLVAEKALGRKLDKGMVVHHINCDKTDNRPDNLLICSISYHLALHARMRRDEYWKNF